MGYDVAAAIDHYVAWLEEPREPDGKWHPSSLWGCTRKAIYEVGGEPPSDPIPPETKRTFRIGHLLHQFIQDAVASDPTVLDAYAEVAVADPELNIVGSADQLIRTVDGWRLLEFKTINPNGFRFVQAGPKDDHRQQALTYMYVLREYGPARAVYSSFRGEYMALGPLGDELTEATVFYLSKGAGMEHISHDIEWSPTEAVKIVTRVGELDGAREWDVLPDRLVAPSGKARHPLCGYCSFVTTCYGRD